MSFSEDLKKEITAFLSESWSKRNGQKVPEPDDLKLRNDAITLDAAVLYADLADSTRLVDAYKPFFAAEIYKSYLHTAAKIIRSQKGVITAYDGDRIMATFTGDHKDTFAVKAALMINYAVKNIINPAIESQYPNTNYLIRQTVGIDTSPLFIARTGIRGSNDLVWVGRAANYAAKLCALSSNYPSWITSDVYRKLNAEVKSHNGKRIWEARIWPTMSNQMIYRSNWWWPI
ncbi:MAG: adenylate/guanylate cyclase domain-containing protein [Candidatus Zixiibacteriota bacterium]|nr:MAG: adenylate/guanylate cyclase domain-containing protein [candidate division Zixibacteria bacterium]